MQTQTPLFIKSPEKEKKTVGKIIIGKFYKWLEETEIKIVILRLVETFIIIFIALLLVAPTKTLEAANFALSYNSYILPQFSTAIYALSQWRKFLDMVKSAKIKKPVHNQNTLAGIPKKELINFLFEKQSFKLKETMDTFGIDRKSFDTLAKKLENDLKVLERGENNSRILSEKYTREEIAKMIMGAKDVKSIKSPLSMKIYQNGKVTETVTTKETVNKNLQNLFTVRKI